MNNRDIWDNTVSAQGQLKDSEYIKYTIANGAKLKVLFVGNSITRHGVKAEIGWTRDCGMAASCLEKDYVHVTAKLLAEKYGPVSFCIAQAVPWELKFYDDSVLQMFSEVQDFDADIVIVRIGENSDMEHLATEDYEAHFDRMVKFFTNPHCKTIVTSLFWQFDAIDIPIRNVAEKNGYEYVSIMEFGARDDCKALTEFEHGGVAKHPNDKGMAEIACRMMQSL